MCAMFSLNANAFVSRVLAFSLPPNMFVLFVSALRSRVT